MSLLLINYEHLDRYSVDDVLRVTSSGIEEQHNDVVQSELKSSQLSGTD